MTLLPFFSKSSKTITSIEGKTYQELQRLSTVAARSYVTRSDAMKFCILPLSLHENKESKVLSISTTSKSVLDVVNYIRFSTGLEVEVVSYATREELQKAIYKAYAPTDVDISHLKTGSAEGEYAHLKVVEPDDDTGRTLFELIDYAHASDSSDIHFVPSSEGGMLSMRRHQTLRSHEDVFLSTNQLQRLINRAKVLASFSPDDHDKPLDGAFMRPTEFGGIKVRLSIMPTIFGEKMVLRITAHAEVRTLSSLGFDEEHTHYLSLLSKVDSGIVVLCGSTGSGKTTTGYAMLRQALDAGRSVVSIEDPVEAHLHGASQTEINKNKGLTYASFLRGVVRQDPDIIFCGEMRDRESITTAFQVALTGHFVLSTMHAGSPREALFRLLDAGVSPQVLVEQIRCILHQTLVPTLCSECRKKISYVLGGHPLYAVSEKGCAHCSYVGVSGSTPIPRLLQPTPHSTEVIDSHSLLKSFVESSIDETLKSLLRDGIITPESAAGLF
jgi:type IV pilus assembly protein PilB